MLWQFVNVFAKTQHIYLLTYSPPVKANIESKLAELIGIQINSSAYGSSILHGDLLLTSYELQPLLTSLFLQRQIFWIESRHLAEHVFMASCCKQSYPVTFLAVCGDLMGIQKIMFFPEK